MEIAHLIMPLLCVLGSVYFIKKDKLAANIFLGYTVINVTSEPIMMVLSYSRIAYIIMFITVILPFAKNRTRLNILNIKRIFRNGKYKRFFLLIMVVWIKIILDSLYYGFNYFRMHQLKSSLYLVFVPVFIILFSLLRHPAEKVVKDLLVGLCFYSLVLLFPVVISGSMISGALFGYSKLGVTAQDSINSGRFIFFGFIGFLLSAFLYREKQLFSVLITVFSFLFFLLIILNGSRQYLFAAMIMIILASFSMGVKRNIKLAALLLVMIVFIFKNLEYFAFTNLAYKINRMTRENTVIYERQEIWKEAYNTASQNPLLGVGYRNFGEESISWGSDGRLVMGKDNAHGFFQEIMVEHGLFIAIPLFLYWLYMVFLILFTKWKIFSYEKRLIFIIFLTLSIPTNFTGAVYNSLGYHLFVLIPFLFQNNKIAHRFVR